jgi:tetratricopeptide (TPR) repeat protein
VFCNIFVLDFVVFVDGILYLALSVFVKSLPILQLNMNLINNYKYSYNYFKSIERKSFILKCLALQPRQVTSMGTQKKVKSKKKTVKGKRDPLSVFDIKRRDLKGKDGKELSREERIRQDKLKLAKRYEAIKLFDDSIKYYKQLGLEDEVQRVTEKKTKLYSERADEFEAGGRYLEAAELYERLDMSEKAQHLRAKSGIKPPPPLDIGEHSIEGGSDPISKKAPQSSKSIRWELPNVEMESVGQKELETSAKASVKSHDKNNKEDIQSKIDESMSVENSGEIMWAGEKTEQNPETVKENSGSGASQKSQQKSFSICPFCGEELNLPKQPKFCPYCREAFM